MDQNTYIFLPKNPQNFECLYCDYVTSNKKDYKKHLETMKHKNKLNTDIEASLNPKDKNFQDYQW